ncbi:hypothetical protein [Chitinophaga filiformis]|uniref:NlpE N-terminal domain-containing protein n=1 Tax=Chitinophaga filiformis TaxID=104663 RepID=A0A1G7HXX4_CHIFI|nr:hypothetical protein [Chitinophaga filiformis]SDF05086.1 hypothetical protein SAMN04488121_101635 [Chitinophaga filiformis]
MIKYLSLIVLLSLLQPELSGVYTRHKQLCSGSQVLDVTWTLTLKKDSNFVYTIKEIDTRAAVKESVSETKGKWTTVNDTLKLLFPVSDTLSFAVMGKRLLAIGGKPIDRNGFIIMLDGLETK